MRTLRWIVLLLGVSTIASGETLVATWGVGSQGTFENRVYVFDSASPGNTTYQNITGLQTNTEFTVDIDFRPADQAMYLLTRFMDDPNDTYRLYTLDPYTGTAIFVGDFTFPTVPGPWSMDLDPVADVFHMVHFYTQQIRISPATGGFLGADAFLHWAPGDPKSGTTQVAVSGLAYDRTTSPATLTTAYGLELVASPPAPIGPVTVRIGDVDANPNGPDVGDVHTVGLIGLTTSGNTAGGFDISPSTGAAFALGWSGDLWSINLATGAATSLGAISGIGGAGTGLAAYPIEGQAAAAVPVLGRWTTVLLIVLLASTAVGILSRRRLF